MTKKIQNKKGFTVAELLIAIAIIMVLAGFGFVSVITQQRRLKLKEADEIAKEMFMAAQNHLKANWANGELASKMADETVDADYFGTPGTGDVYTAVSFVEDGSRNSMNEALGELILPFGSVDETIRLGGSYLVRYNRKTTTVLDVFYCGKSDGITSADQYNALKTLVGKSRDERIKAARSGGYIGYYGGGDTGIVNQIGEGDSQAMEKASVIVRNKEMLWVEIVDPNYTKFNSYVEVTFNGQQSGKRVTRRLVRKDETRENVKSDYPLETADYCKTVASTTDTDGFAIYYILMDSITNAGGHFVQRFPDFLPGENINVSVTIKSAKAGMQVETTSQTFSSLFGEEIVPVEGQKGYYNAIISNGRHLQNLTQDVSHVNYKRGEKNETCFVISGELTGDITWEDRSRKEGIKTLINARSFWEQLTWEGSRQYLTEAELLKSWTTGTSVLSFDGNSITGATGKTFIPIDPQFAASGSQFDKTEFALEGNEYSVNDLLVSFASARDLGLFSSVAAGNTLGISNLMLGNPYVEASSGNAGSYVGSNAGTLTMSNCGVKEAATVIFEKTVDEATKTITYTDWLTGSANEKEMECLLLAAQYEGGAITEPESGTWSKPVTDGRRIYTASGNAGGLIGASTGTLTATGCFASVPVSSGASGASGGLIGAVSGTATVEKCYSGGHTKDGEYADTSWNVVAIGSGGKAGGLIGEVNGAVTTKNCYSTCSALADTAGGLLGAASGDGGSVTGCYAVGKVKGSSKEGAFIGNCSLASGTPSIALSGNYYYEIVNEKVESEGISYLPAIPADSSGTEVTLTGEKIQKLDADAATYEGFTGVGAGKKQANAKANVYDTKLLEYYGQSDGNYLLKTVDQLAGSEGGLGFAREHFGDWPSPECMVINTPA